jgi:bifunctional non-homologous end joining protein LigD
LARTQSARATETLGEKSKKQKGVKADRYPGFVPPCLATLSSDPPPGKSWVHEIKFDGYRLQVHIRSGDVKLLTRRGLDWTPRFGRTLISALADLPANVAIIDGEAIVEGREHVADFSALQDALARERTESVIFYAFDLLYLEGKDLRQKPLLARKDLLRALLAYAEPALRYSEHFDESGDVVLRHACELKLEGVVSKLRNAPYRSGRNKDWIKSKCSARQEFVIAGYKPSTVSSYLIGSLVLGYYDGGKLIHAGRVGTGYTQKIAADLFRRLQPLRVPKSPFANKLPSKDVRGVHFVRPELVAEIELRDWTADRYVRHGSFKGLREDKRPEEVVLEFPVSADRQA